MARSQPKHPPDITAISHWIFLVKENRSFDHFGTFPGANGTTSGPIFDRTNRPLAHSPDVMPQDLKPWAITETAMDYGRMDKFDVNCVPYELCMSQVYQQENIQTVFGSYASTFTLADEAFCVFARRQPS